MASLTTLALIPQCDNQSVVTWYSVVLTIIFVIAVLVCLVVAIIYLRRYVIYLLREYQKPPPLTIGIHLFPLHGMMLGPRFTFTTRNTTNMKFEYDQPIQSARFIKPVEKVIFPTDVPAFIHCENSIMCRLRNKMLGIPTPRIVVRQFTEKGIIFDEENTYGVDYIVELTPMAPQIKQPLPDSQV